MSYLGPSITLTPAEMERKLEEAKRKAMHMAAFPFKQPKPVVVGNLLAKKAEIRERIPDEEEL